MNASDHAQLMVALLYIAVFLVAGIAYLVWVNGANKALRESGVQGLKYGPGSAVGVYFIPFYNLVAGYQVMDEVWKAAHATRGEDSGPMASRKVRAACGVLVDGLDRRRARAAPCESTAWPPPEFR